MTAHPSQESVTVPVAASITTETAETCSVAGSPGGPHPSANGTVTGFA
jgi:hypothetical protein